MTTSTSRLAFIDCLDIFDKAFNDPVGVRVMFPDYGKAAHFITRMHRFREIDRADNARTFVEVEHPLHGRSTYDQCVVRRPRPDEEGNFWVYVEKMTIDNMVIESLSEAPELLEYQPPRLIEHIDKEAAE